MNNKPLGVKSKPFTLKQIKGHLQKLNDRWPDNYWLFAAGGGLILMKKEQGHHVFIERGSANPNYEIAKYHGIDADGGDW